MRKISIILASILSLVTTAAIADAPAPVPFFYATGTLLEPQIATLLVGVNDSPGRASVSGDRKYVTMDINADLLSSGGIHNFSYQQGGVGFVGSAAPVKPVTDANNLTPTIVASPSEVAPRVSILDKPGMVLIAPLER